MKLRPRQQSLFFNECSLFALFVWNRVHIFVANHLFPMPFIRCVFSGDPSLKLKLMASLSKALATSMGKPEAVVMCHVEHSSSLMFGGSVDPAAMINVESIGSDLVSIIPTLTEVSRITMLIFRHASRLL